jgi:hypothetical protein
LRQTPPGETSSDVDEGGRGSEHRVAAVRERFRRANDELQSRYLELGADGALPFICECVDERCTRVIALTAAEYAAVRTRPRQFALVPGHETGDDHVLHSDDRYSVAEAGDVRLGSQG